MALLIFLMLGVPGFHDTKQMASAVKHYQDSPSDLTRKELENARITGRKQIDKIELVLGTFLAASAIAFFGLGRKTKSPSI